MKRYKSIRHIALTGCFVLLAAACTDKFGDYNTNPHEATEDMLDYDNLKIGGFIPQMQRDVIPTSDELANQFQRAQNLAGDIYSGYMGAIGTWGGGNNGTTYNLSYDNWNNVAFEVGFQSVMPAWKKVADLAKDEFPETYALAQVLKVAAMHRVTDIYGPLPYLKFGHGGITTPYDSQEAIYLSFFEDLNEAIEILDEFVTKYPSARPLKKFDMVYGGDFSKWLTFANSLKLRLAMRIVYVDEELAKKYAQQAVEAGVMLTNADNAQLASANGVSVFHPLKKCWDDYSDIRMGANMDSFLNGYNDGRLSRYFRESTLSVGGYHGARTGIWVYNKSSYLPLSVPNIEASNPVQWMCAAEMYFLRAEGAARGWSGMGGTAQGLYEEGIRTSFEQWGAELGNYLTNSTRKPAAFDDYAGFSSIPANSSYLSTITIAWEENVDIEVKLERILTQKWLAMFPDGQEAWTEFRRTGYPKVFPVVYNFSGGTIDTDIQIRRITFPPSEYNNNTDEVTKAAELLGGPDTGGTRLWWDKK